MKLRTFPIDPEETTRQSNQRGIMRRNRLKLYSLPLLLIVALVIIMRPASSQGIDIILPTSNDGIFTGSDSTFYQRTASGRKEPWRGGCYGFTRNPKTTSGETIYTRYHAGIDIAPLYRDARGEPLDSIVAISNGRVVHVSDRSGRSNYGKYVVIEHYWDGSPYYSLYAHLSDIWVEPGKFVMQGDPIARMGYTGDGINRARAHLHLEINLLINGNFHAWYANVYNDSNQHGLYNGINLVAIDVARLYLALCDDPDLTMEEFLAAEKPFFQVTLPIEQQPDILRRYPWLLVSHPDSRTNSWTVAFTSYGLPLWVEPSNEQVDAPGVKIIEPADISYRWLTKSMITGQKEKYSLSRSGERYIELMTTTAEQTPPVEKDTVIQVAEETR
jgi:murein DD-endopeptidase MepM/ murein hydrolase activator NlpD